MILYTIIGVFALLVVGLMAILDGIDFKRPRPVFAGISLWFLAIPGLFSFAMYLFEKYLQWIN